MNVDGAGTSAMRRRQRRLRAVLRHERQTVAMELAAALHHSRDGRACDELRPTGTEDSKFRWVAGRPEGARAAGRGSHGRLRGCPGSAPRGGVDGWG